MRYLAFFLVAARVAKAACPGGAAETSFFRDSDEDGHGDPAVSVLACAPPSGYVATSTDCDDTAPFVHPAAPELCNGKDDDCDAKADDGLPKHTYWLDTDGDGVGVDTLWITGCAAKPGYVLEKGDCDDGSSHVFPGAQELCNGADDDCDDLIDEDLPVLTFYPDGDGDGFGDPGPPETGCSAPDGWVIDATDCDDQNDAANPGIAEECNGKDDNCNGDTDEAMLVPLYVDADDDGAGGDLVAACPGPGFSTASGDCDDSSPSVGPHAAEVSNAVDDDCDGLTDEALSTLDEDEDGVSSSDGDCNDKNPAISPELAELPNGLDDDCDGQVDNGTALADDDGDGYSEIQNDCDDGDATQYPGAPEAPDGADDDCDGLTDEGTAIVDDDGDGAAESQDDCNDLTTLVGPDAPELLDGLDNDCDGLTDELEPGAGKVDGDNDGWPASADCDDGDAEIHPQALEVPNEADDDCDGKIDDGTVEGDDDGDGLSEAEGDCNDKSAAVHAGAVELPNGADDDCDGAIDEATIASDDDDDGFTEDQGDCNDANGAIGPGAAETPNGLDDDCDDIPDNVTEGPVDGVPVNPEEPAVDDPPDAGPTGVEPGESTGADAAGSGDTAASPPDGGPSKGVPGPSGSSGGCSIGQGTSSRGRSSDNNGAGDPAGPLGSPVASLLFALFGLHLVWRSATLRGFVRGAFNARRKL